MRFFSGAPPKHVDESQYRLESGCLAGWKAIAWPGHGWKWPPIRMLSAERPEGGSEPK
jgi:hypothetical protein